MRKINIGSSKYTEVFAADEPEHNACHEYSISTKEDKSCVANISFQKGPIKENRVNGCHHEDLISIVIDRLQSFQKSEYSCRENSIAITKLEEALMWLNKRTQDRINRGVEGTHIV